MGWIERGGLLGGLFGWAEDGWWKSSIGGVTVGIAIGVWAFMLDQSIEDDH